VVTIILLIVLKRTPLKNFSILAAMILGSMLPLVLGWENVMTVQDIAPIPDQLPIPFIPDLSTLPDLVAPALALAIVGLVQGAAISTEFPNPDGSKSDPSGDFTGQGMANIISGFFQGMPVGGSFSATAILADSGARTRFANIVAGVGIGVLFLLFRDVIGLLAMPSIAGFLVLLGVSVLKPKEVAATWRLGGLSRYGMVLMMLIALFVSLQTSVFVGVVLAMILYIIRQSNDVTVKECIYEDGELVAEQDVNPELASNAIVSLQHYGSLFFASAQNYEVQLPTPGKDTRNAVVILNLRGQKDPDSTVLDMLTEYAQVLQKQHCRLMLAGVGASFQQKLEKTGKVAIIGDENVFTVSMHYHESVLKAHEVAETWIKEQKSY
jgi:SulP family sulfate permease